MEDFAPLGKKVNKQDFLQVFQGSGIGKIEDKLRSADPLSYRGDLEKFRPF